MAGVGKLLKQAQKMQKKMEALQEELAQKELEVTSGGGAIKIVITGQSELKSLKLDPEFLKEDAEFVEETLLAALQEANQKAKATYEEAMSELSGGMSMPGLF
ncbi:MAG: YbaB/EbfC family nucleoid-associated protein [Puniceicoccaceae bacterium]